MLLIQTFEKRVRGYLKQGRSKKVFINVLNSFLVKILSTVVTLSLIPISLHYTDAKTYGVAFLLRKREETALLQVSTVSDTRAVDKAESSIDPVSPKAKLVYPAAMILALLVGIAFVSYKEFMNSRVLFRSQIEDVCTIPIVAEIAKSNSKNSLVVNDPEMVVLSEQFRHLRAAIGIFGKVHKKKTHPRNLQHLG